MHILINALSAVAGGSLTYLRNAVPALASHFAATRDHHMTLLLHRSQQNLLPVDFTAAQAVVDGPMPTGWRRTLWERENLPDHLKGVDTYFVPYQACHLPSNVRTVVMLRNMEPFLHWRYPYDLKNRLRNIALRRLSEHTLRKADHVIAVSGFAHQYLIDRLRVPKARISTIAHGCSPAFSQTVQTFDRGLLDRQGVMATYIFTSGSLLPYRRLEDVVNAFAYATRRRPDLQLVITGSGTDRRYAAKVNAAILKTGANILSLGIVDVQTMAALYRNSLAFVTATEIEACPNTVIEALTSGCAIVASDAPPLPEFIHDRGLYFPARQTEKLAERVSEIAENPSLRLKLSQQAAMADFSWPRCAKQTFEALTAPTGH